MKTKNKVWIISLLTLVLRNVFSTDLNVECHKYPSGTVTMFYDNLVLVRPTVRVIAYGTVDRSVETKYSGQITFPDARTFTFFFYPDEGAFYKDGDKGETSNIWSGGVLLSDCTLALFFENLKGNGGSLKDTQSGGDSKNFSSQLNHTINLKGANIMMYNVAWALAGTFLFTTLLTCALVGWKNLRTKVSCSSSKSEHEYEIVPASTNAPPPSNPSTSGISGPPNRPAPTLYENV